MNGDSNYFLDRLLQPSEVDLFGPLDLVLAMTVSALLCFVLASVYRRHNRKNSHPR